MTLGEKIRKTRLARGLTQAQLAGDCVTRNMLSQIENDAAKPSMRTLQHIARTLDVQVSWLLEQTSMDTGNLLAQGRELYRQGEYGECLSLLQTLSTPSDEAHLLLALCADQLARQAVDGEDYAQAASLAQEALSHSGQCLYPLPHLQIFAAAVLARCCMGQHADAEEAIAALRERYLRLQPGVGYHLLLAQYHLSQEHVQAAEREIWSIAELPDEAKAEYLILRGHIANRKEQFENAALYFQQAEELQPAQKRLLRLLYAGLERCCKEREQYKQAYEYAAKQRDL